MSISKFQIFAAIAIVVAGPSDAVAEELPREAKSIEYLQVIADRGLACGLLTEWQSQSFRAQIMEPIRDWDMDIRQRVAENAKKRAAETPCDDASLTTYIEGAERGFESEFLPPYLVIYRTLAEMAPPPKVFEAVTLRYDYAEPIAAINAKLAALEASGAKPEGGKSWTDYIALTASRAEEIGQLISGAETESNVPVDLAAAYMAQSALITELWVEEEKRREGAQ